MEELSDASLLKIRNNNTLTILAEEYQFIARHSIQRTFQLEFLKCTDSKCGHCTDKPNRSQKPMTFLRTFGGGHNFNLRISPDFPGHYQTWHSLASAVLEGEITLPSLDEGLSTSMKGARLCTKGRSKVFQSAADRERHDRLLHKFEHKPL